MKWRKFDPIKNYKDGIYNIYSVKEDAYSIIYRNQSDWFFVSKGQHMKLPFIRIDYLMQLHKPF